LRLSKLGNFSKREGVQEQSHQAYGVVFMKGGPMEYLNS
jgi:hypothetical protein